MVPAPLSSIVSIRRMGKIALPDDRRVVVGWDRLQPFATTMQDYPGMLRASPEVVFCAGGETM